jgi:hypothetical protein
MSCRKKGYKEASRITFRTIKRFLEAENILSMVMFALSAPAEPGIHERVAREILF